MKGLNIKRIAAIGLGAALVGSALAPVVSAANVVPTGLDELGRDTVITATGAPAVDIVVGASASVSDVVWAGNIAARVAQLATKPVTCSASSGTVDLTVGGTTSLSGAGEVFEKDFSASTTEFTAVDVSNTKMPTLVNNTSFKYNWGSTTQKTMSLTETLEGTLDVSAQMQTGSTRYAVGELVGTAAAEQLKYRIEFQDALDMTAVSGTQRNLDANSQFDLKISILGKEYVLDQILDNKQTLVFYSSTTPTEVAVGDELTVQGRGSYAGKTLTVVLSEMVQIGSGNQVYRAKWALKDGSSTVDIKEGPVSSTNDFESYDLKTVFGDKFTDSIWVTSSGLNLVANKYVATVRTGSDRLEIRDGYGFPYTRETTVDNKAQWKAKFDLTGGLKAIEIVNQWAYNKTVGSETDISKYVLKVGESVTLPNNFGKFTFLGFQDKAMTEITVGNNALNFKDMKGSEIEVPFYHMFSYQEGRPTLVKIANQEYTFWFEDANFAYAKGDRSSAETATAVGSNNGFNFVAGTNAGLVTVDLGVRPYSGTGSIDVNYILDANRVTNTAFLLLAENQFDVYSKSSTVPSTIKFVGTYDNGDSDASIPYYVPNASEYVKDVLGAVYQDKNNYAATFVYNDGKDVNLYVKADMAGDVWDYDSIKDLDSTYGKDGPSLDATYPTLWGTTAIRGGSNYLMEGFTEYGSEVVSDGSVFTVSVPYEARQVEFYIGSTNLTPSTVGGSSYTGVAAGETKGNVTVTAVNCGGSGASAVEVVPVSNLVKTAKGSGKSIIVGGWVANAAAANLEVSAGNTLEKLLINSGDYVAAVLASGDIVVAGFSGNDTGRAAQDLISALEGLM